MLLSSYFIVLLSFPNDVKTTDELRFLSGTDDRGFHSIT